MTGFKYETVVVDVETTGFDYRQPTRFAVEVAWWNLTTGERGYFIPVHDEDRALIFGDPTALEMCRYRERILGKLQDVTGSHGQHLEVQLDGHTLAGSNPRFDEAFLLKFLAPTWHYALLDLKAYAMGRLGLNYLPGLAEVCDLLGIDRPDHTATGDVMMTGQCFLELVKR